MHKHHTYNQICSGLHSTACASCSMLRGYACLPQVVHIMTCHDPFITPESLLTAMHCMPAQVARPQKPPQVLQGNAGEVTEAVWSSMDHAHHDLP